ncbi:hypothetical protein ACS0TY_002727 [Phlomoides rotata]
MASLDRVARNIRVKIKADFRKPLRRGIQLELKDGKKVWVEFKYKRLSSFCYFCGMLGHMRRECDLTEGVEVVEDLSGEKLSVGEWMRASPLKKASISVDENMKQTKNISLRR